MYIETARMSESCKHSIIENYPKMYKRKMNEVKSTCLHNSLLLVNPAVGRSVDFLGRSCGSIIKTHP